MTPETPEHLAAKIALEAWEAAGKARVLACSRAHEAAYQLFCASTVETYDDLISELLSCIATAEDYGRTQEIYCAISGKEA